MDGCMDVWDMYGCMGYVIFKKERDIQATRADVKHNFSGLSIECCSQLKDQFVPFAIQRFIEIHTGSVKIQDSRENTQTISCGGWGIFILCCLLLLTARAEWINQTNGPGTLLVSRNGTARRGGRRGVKAHALENELLSFKPKIPHDGKAAKWHCTVTAPC